MFKAEFVGIDDSLDREDVCFFCGLTSEAAQIKGLQLQQCKHCLDVFRWRHFNTRKYWIVCHIIQVLENLTKIFNNFPGWHNAFLHSNWFYFLFVKILVFSLLLFFTLQLFASTLWNSSTRKQMLSISHQKVGKVGKVRKWNFNKNQSFKNRKSDQI